ncbi:DUF86 domain-containing protein [Pseudanabaena sp. BC1403]|uniref:HepT-like ribonuclease domain-containing protein n=1 Tax=Pseudanabaena sp. BC1403 TaxID=2043171 RepID=UPI000CD8FC45|nr:DUF86 domain-containing protein [Pseudanabaena sp. BC1403]
MSRDQEAIIDITESIKLILQYMTGIDQEALAVNYEKQDAILRRVTIIGEATKRLSQEFRQNHPAIPWKKIAGMRDVITHDYDEIDLTEIWTVITENIPELLKYLENLHHTNIE